tara:strand:+ start:32738 stop:32938 length:201 start_codon:yes stop_codon:yes gene_type:complete
MTDKVQPGPFKDAVEAEADGVVRAILITYKQRDGILVKETTTRNYYGIKDYHDSWSSEPLCKLAKD